jgi:hypothetical protein
LSWSLFPEKEKNDKRDFTTRLDTAENEFKFTILSTSKPTMHLGALRNVGRQEQYRICFIRKTDIFLRFLPILPKHFPGEDQMEIKKKMAAIMLLRGAMIF